MQMNDIKIGVVVSAFNPEITDQLLESTLAKLHAMNIKKENISVVTVPGAVEIPLMTRALATAKKLNAVICLGAVIRGETNHYDYVCQQVSQGCQAVMLELNIPVVFGVLTTNNLKQAYARIDKGKEAAETAIAMVKLLQTHCHP